ncbi:MAG: biotin/lipoyl-containing protein [Oscillospiraceae bacterium]
MKSFRVTVNGTPYDVQVEELAPGAAPAAIPAAPVPAPQKPAALPAQPAASAATPASAAPAGAEKIVSPMPGTILDIKVSPGQKVEEKQVLMILEAMKMENEIVAPVAGTVQSIHVSRGDSVETGALLVAIS